MVETISTSTYPGNSFRSTLTFLPFDLDDFLDRHERLADRLVLVGARVFLDAPIDQRPDLVLMARGRLDRIPPVFHDGRLHYL